MNRMMRLSVIVPFIIIMAGACSTMRTEKGADSFAALADNQPYQLRVRSGHSIMDRIIYETASRQFGKYLSLSRTDSYQGTIEIIFAGTANKSFLDSTTDFATSSVTGNAWYIGSEYIGLSGSDSAEGAGSSFENIDLPEKTTMLVNIKGPQGEGLWTGNYQYKGAELADLGKTEEKIAKTGIKKIMNQLRKDFPTMREATR